METLKAPILNVYRENKNKMFPMLNIEIRCLLYDLLIEAVNHANKEHKMLLEEGGGQENLSSNKKNVH